MDEDKKQWVKREQNKAMKNFNFWDMDLDAPPPTAGCKYLLDSIGQGTCPTYVFRKEWIVPNFKKSTKSVDVKNADTVCKYSLEKSLKTCSEQPTRLGAYFMVPF